MNIIIGTGISAIGAYYADGDVVLYEKSDKAGGLCGGFDISGYHFDQAVHLSFTTNGFVRKLFNSLDKKPVRRLVI